MDILYFVYHNLLKDNLVFILGVNFTVNIISWLTNGKKTLKDHILNLILSLFVSIAVGIYMTQQRESEVLLFIGVIIGTMIGPNLIKGIIVISNDFRAHPLLTAENLIKTIKGAMR